DGLRRRALIVVEPRKDAGGQAARRVVDQSQPRPRRLGLAVMPWRSGCHARLGRFGSRSFRDRRIEQQSAGGEPLELAVLEQADDAVFAVIARLADHPAATDAKEISMEWTILLCNLSHLPHLIPSHH